MSSAAAVIISPEHFDNLQLLLKAPSKEAVREVCVQSFKGSTRRLTENTATVLSVTDTQAAQLIESLHTLTHHVIFWNLHSADQILSVFPEAFHCSLKKMLAKILMDNCAAWRTEALSSQISLPQLKQVEWRVDLVTGSDSVNRMAVPTCIVQLQTCDPLPPPGSAPVSMTTVELSREALDTMLDGLQRIREQLGGVAGK